MIKDTEITWRFGSSPNPARYDAIFYTGFGHLATVSCEGFEVDIFCDGETKANLLNAEGEVVDTLFTPDDFDNAGINTDVALRLANEQNLLDWINNSWFDMYCYGEHLDCVSHSISEAIGYAETYVKDRRVSEYIINGEGSKK